MDIFSQEYQDWLKTVKPGDEIAYDTSASYARKPSWSIDKVTKITPTGRFSTEKGNRFMPNGRMIGTEYGTRMVPITDGIRDEIKRNNLLRKISNVKWNEMSIDILEHVVCWVDYGKEREENGSVS